FDSFDIGQIIPQLAGVLKASYDGDAHLIRASESLTGLTTDSGSFGIDFALKDSGSSRVHLSALGASLGDLLVCSGGFQNTTSVDSGVSGTFDLQFDAQRALDSIPGAKEAGDFVSA